MTIRCFRCGVALAACLAFLALAVPGVAGAAVTATVTFTVQASSSGFPPGVGIFDTVNLGQGANPTGTLSFRLFAPENPACSGAALFTTNTPVTGTGYYASASFVPDRSGTYRWIASYSGDAANGSATSACEDPTQAVSVAKKSPTLNGTAGPVAGGAITDSATLDKGAGPSGPAGNLTFTLFGPDNLMCGGTPVLTSTKTVTGNGTFTSDPFRPTAPGGYRWIVKYSGDANNLSAQTICSDPAQAVDVTAVAAASNHTPGDFGGDGKADVAVYRPSTGTWYVSTPPADTATWGAPEDIPVPGDYDGNGTTDVAVYRPSTATWFILGGANVVWGLLGDIPVPGDYDGNGTTDIAVYRPSLGLWYVYGGPTVLWGLLGDIPVPGDYDGNGTTDFAVYRPSLGLWYVHGQPTVHWGVLGDIPVPGDYDGNGTTEMAIYRSGSWYIRGAVPSAPPWGGVGDVPVPADYDGDGTTDVAVYRPATGAWYISGPGGSAQTVLWGVTGDVPVALPAAVRQSFF